MAKRQYEKLVELFGANQNAETTRDVYTRELRRFFEVSGLNDVKKVKVEHILEYKASNKDMAPMTQRRRLSVLRQFFKFCCDIGALKHNPTKGVKLPRGQSRDPRPLTRKEAEKLLSVIDRTTLTGKRDYAFLVLMLNTGLRLAEALRLNDTDIINDKRHCLVRVNGKGNREDSVKLVPEVRRALDAWLKVKPGDSAPLFTTSQGRRIGPRAVQLRLNLYAEKAGFERPVSPHDLRHTFARLSHHAGTDVLLIQEALRHRSLETTHRYLRRMARLDDTAFDRLRPIVA